MTPSNADQDDIINFIDDPNTINKAVEGSMDKRLKVLADAELRDAIEKILQTGAMTYDNGNKQVLFSADTHVEELLALFQAREQQLLTELLKDMEDEYDERGAAIIKLRLREGL